MTQDATGSTENLGMAGTPKEKKYFLTWLGTEYENYKDISEYVARLGPGEEKSWWDGWLRQYYAVPPAKPTSKERSRKRRYSYSSSASPEESIKRGKRGKSAPKITSTAGGAVNRYLQYVAKFLIGLASAATIIRTPLRRVLYPALRPLISQVAANIAVDIGSIAVGVALAELMFKGGRLLNPGSGSGLTRAAVAAVATLHQRGVFQFTLDRLCLCRTECKKKDGESRYTCKVLEGAEGDECPVKEDDEAECNVEWRAIADFHDIAVARSLGLGGSGAVSVSSSSSSPSPSPSPMPPLSPPIDEDRKEKDRSPRGFPDVPSGSGISGSGTGLSAAGRVPSPPGETFSQDPCASEAPYWVRLVAYTITLLVFGTGAGAVLSVVRPYVVLQSFLFIVGALYAISATVRSAREMLSTIFNLLLNTGLGLGFFDVRDDSLEAFLQRLETAVTPRQVSPILFSHLLDPLRDAFLGVGVDPSFCSVYEKVLHMVWDHRTEEFICAQCSRF